MDDQQPTYKIKDNSDVKKDAVLDDQLIDAYIGKNVKYFRKDGFSFPIFLAGLFFNFFYYIYRKMGGYAVRLLICLGVIGSSYVIFLIAVVGDPLAPQGSSVGNIQTTLALIFLLSLLSIPATIIILALLFKRKYMEDVRVKVNYIKENNPGKSNDELIEICKKKGGTTLKPFIITISVILLLFLYIEVRIYLEDKYKILKYLFR